MPSDTPFILAYFVDNTRGTLKEHDICAAIDFDGEDLC